MRPTILYFLAALFSFLVPISGCSFDEDGSSGSGQAASDDTAPAADDSADDIADDVMDDAADDSADDSADDDTDASPALPAIRDDDGRQILLRGANYMGMEFGWFDHSPEDFQRMADWGFNAVRLPIAWNFLEPEQGVWDESYLTDVVGPVVGYASDAGLKVIVDMHQWQWCPPYGGNGIPSWTCEAFAYLDYPWDILVGSGEFWTHPEYLDDFVEAWDRVASFFEGDNRIFAFDLFNEPWAGVRTLPWTCENSLIRPLYIRFIETIRAHMPSVHILFEPSIIRASGFPSVMDPLPYDRVIYAPHLYPGTTASDNAGYNFTRDQLVWYAGTFRKDAIRLGAPLLFGEVGVLTGAYKAEEYVVDVTAILDGILASYTWWTFWRDDNGFGLLDAAGNEKSLYIDSLSRPYVRKTMGTLTKIAFDPETKEFSVSFDNFPIGDPDATIYLPGGKYPNGFTVQSTDPDGAWSWTFDEDRRELLVLADPASETHRINVRPE